MPENDRADQAIFLRVVPPGNKAIVQGTSPKNLCFDPSMLIGRDIVQRVIRLGVQQWEPCF